MYVCEWDTCDEKFWSMVDLERHVKRHVNELQPEKEKQAESRTSRSSSRSSVDLGRTVSMDQVLRKSSLEPITNSDTSELVERFRNGKKRAESLDELKFDKAEQGREEKLKGLSRVEEKEEEEKEKEKEKESGESRNGKSKDKRESKESIQTDDCQENIVCIVCRKGDETTGNFIVLCDGCDRPFHQICHRPNIGNATVEDWNSKWYCRHCSSKRPGHEHCNECGNKKR